MKKEITVKLIVDSEDSTFVYDNFIERDIETTLTGSVNFYRIKDIIIEKISE